MSGKDKNGARLLTEEELVELKTTLQLPDHVIDYLRNQPRLSALANGVGITIFIILMIVFGLLPLAMYNPAFAQFLHSEGFIPDDTILVNLDFVGAIPGAFAAVLLAAYLLYRSVRLLPNVYMKSIVSNLYQVVQPGQKYKGIVIAEMRWLLKGLDTNAPSQEFLRAFDRRHARMLGRGALVLYLIALPVLLLDLKSADIVTRDGVVISPYFSNSVLRHDWGDVVGIWTGCDTSRGKSTSHTLRYRLEFEDGKRVNPGSWTPVKTSLIDALEFIDRKLNALDVPKEQGEVEQSCLDAKRRKFGERDFERLRQLL